MISGHKPFSRGERVYQVIENIFTKEERRVFGTVTADEIPGWDYINVLFDEIDDGMPWSVPIRSQVCIMWSLFRVEVSLFSQDVPHD